MNLNIIFCQLNNSDKYLNVKLILHAFHIFRFYVHLIFVLYFVSRVVTYYYLLSICLDPDKFSCIWHFAFFFFFLCMRLSFYIQSALFMQCSHTIHALFTGPTTTLFRKKILKMGLMALFIHLKIILLQYFQFSRNLSSHMLR